MKLFKSSGRVAVLIPLYKQSLSIAEEYSLANTLRVLGSHDLYIIGPERLKEHFLSTYKKAESDFRIALYPDKFFSSIKGYNKLLMSNFFYKSFSDYEYILILQADALVFSDVLDSWCDRNYSYVGAPWFVGIEQPERPLSFLGVGNGGLSLRKVEDHIRVLSSPRYMPNFLPDNIKQPISIKLFRWFIHHFIYAYNFYPFFPKRNEDFFWGLFVPRYCGFFTVPSAEDAVSFSFEAEPSYLYKLNQNQLPFGCHAWEKYDVDFWRQVLSERGMQLP